MAVAVVGVLAGTPAPAAAQDEMPVSISAGVDIPSLYYFRGFRQEFDPKLTMWPWIDVGASILEEGTGAVKSATLNVGLWNSVHTGSSGSDTAGQSAFYETDFYATLGLGFESFELGTTYTLYASPNDSFDRIHEIAIKGSVSHMLAPYGLIAFEFAEDDPGTYLELGVGPSWPLGEEEGAPTLTVPVKLGFGLKDYYDDGAAFGFFSVGGTVDYPVNEMVSIRGGVEILSLGEGAEASNVNADFETSKTGFVVFGGIGFAF
jgi:hypothetical protein